MSEDLDDPGVGEMADEPARRRPLVDEDDEAEEAAEGEEKEDAGDGEDEGPGEVKVSYLVTGRRVWTGASNVIFPGKILIEYLHAAVVKF